MPKESTDPLELIEEVVRKRAYQLYEERGFEPGHEVDDWLQAEEEITGKKKPARVGEEAVLNALLGA